MIKPFILDVQPIQLFKANPQNYSSFGLAGHDGCDWMLPCGTPQICPEDTNKIYVGWDAKGWGNFVYGYSQWGEWILAHFQLIKVKSGQSLKQGELIGLTGTTGNSSGCHCHFGVKRNGVTDPSMKNFVNPLKYIQEDNMGQINELKKQVEYLLKQEENLRKDVESGKLLLTDLTKVNEGLKRSNDLMVVFIDEIRKTYNFDVGVSLDEMIKKIVEYERQYEDSRKHETIARELYKSLKDKLGATSIYPADWEGLSKGLQRLTEPNITLSAKDFTFIKWIILWFEDRRGNT